MGIANQIGYDLGESGLSGSFETDDTADQSLALSEDFDVGADEFTADSFETDAASGESAMDSFTTEDIDVGGSGVNINLNFGKTK